MQNNKKEKRGIIYTAFGYEYLIMALYSAKTVKKTNPGIVCELVTNLSYDNLKVKESPFDSVKKVEYENKFNRMIKTNIIEYASFDIGAYFDCDTEIRGSLDPIFKCLERFDIAIIMNTNPTDKDYEIAPGINSHFFPAWNSGVIFFRKNEKAKALFKRWSKIYKQEKKSSDQPALARAIYDTPDLRLLSLNAIWNTFQGVDIMMLKYKKLSALSIKRLKNSIIWHYRKPDQWPYVAPELYRIYQHLHNSKIFSGESESIEIDNIGRKYKIFSSPFYRFIFNKPLLRRIFEITLTVLNRLGIIQRVKLKRDKHFIGESYKRRIVR